MENIDSGFIKLSGEADRIQVASILFKNGYTVRTARTKKNGKTYEYYVRYEKENPDFNIEVEQNGDKV